MQQPQQFSNGGSAATSGAPSFPGLAPTTAPPGQAPPNEGLYGEYQANALQAYQQAMAAIQAKRSGIYQSYGFNADGSVDGHNMVGQYQQMKHAQALELQGAENQALDRGLGTHGLGAQVAEAPRFQEDVDSANLGNSYLSALDQNSQDLLGAGSTYQQALVDARRQQIQDDIANARYDTPTDPGSAPPAGTKTTKTTSVVGKNAKSTAARLAAATRGKRPGTPVAVRVKANKSGASANKRQGIYTIH